VFGKRVAVLENQEGSAYGAALLAMVGTGEYSSVREVTKATIREVRVCEPQVEEGEIYKAGYRVYRALYPATKGALWVERLPNTS
jgi:xylulokinase